MTDTERIADLDTRRPMGRRETLSGHKGHASGAGVECSCGERFASWEEFGRHVDDLLAAPPHTPGQAVENVLADHLGDPYGRDGWCEYLEPSIGDHGSFECGCGWKSSGPDIDEWRRHMSDAILAELARVPAREEGERA